MFLVTFLASQASKLLLVAFPAMATLLAESIPLQVLNWWVLPVEREGAAIQDFDCEVASDRPVQLLDPRSRPARIIQSKPSGKSSLHKDGMAILS